MVLKCHVRLQATICICNNPNFVQATICICNSPKCNDWSTNGTVTTNVPVTDGSGVLCYRATADNYEATYCKKNETMCAYMQVDSGGEMVISSFALCSVSCELKTCSWIATTRTSTIRHLTPKLATPTLTWSGTANYSTANSAFATGLRMTSAMRIS